MLNTQNSAPNPHANTLSQWRAIGVWLSLILVVYMLFNAVRATVNPVDFAANFGTPLDAEGNTAFVIVYAIRALFLGLFGLALIIRSQWKTLAIYALVALVMPVGDALLVATQGGAPSIVARHVATAFLLVVTWFFLQRWIRKIESTN